MMNQDPKYIVFEELYDYPCTVDIPMIIFPTMINHERMAKMVGGNPISAGFINMESGSCYGISESLKLKSNPEQDNKLFQMQINKNSSNLKKQYHFDKKGNQI